MLCPWLGPDQFAAWLGAELVLKPRAFTSWAKPFVEDWDEHPEFRIAPDNRWWKLYRDILQESVRAGQDKWVTGYPDLHTGVDALECDSRPGPPGAGFGGEPCGRASRDGADDCSMEMGGGYRFGDRPAGRSRHNQLDDGLEQPALSLHRPE